MMDSVDVSGEPVDPAPAHRDWVDAAAPSARVPNLLHTAVLLILTVVAFALIGGVTAALPHAPKAESIAGERQMLAVEALVYLITLAASWRLFPRLWRRSFLSGISWNLRGASPWLAGLGLIIGIVTQLVETRLPLPTHAPIETLTQSTALIWPLILLGTLIAPLFEEIVFRGFLLPACAHAVDWLRTPRSSEAYAQWRAAKTWSAPAIMISSVVTSALFGALHGPQLGASVPAMLVLGTISLILCAVRLRTGSLAASTLVHAFYNLSIFITLFIASDGFKHLDRLH